MEKVSEFDIQRTCAFTGNRILRKDFNEDFLYKEIENAINRGYKTFLVGMARGFDLKCFEYLLKFKNYNIDIIACVPCKEQNKFYSKNDNENYNLFLSLADKVIYVNENYFEGCMQQRNRFMVDNSSLIIAYDFALFGGTKTTVDYAKKRNREIVFIK